MSATGLETTTILVASELASEVASDAGSSADNEVDRALEIFLSQRTRLFRIAYRVVDDVSGAEDVVQEAWLRWQRTDHSTIKNPAAFLTTTTTHLAINVIQSARHRHETPTDSPFIELVDRGDDPTSSLERAAVVERTLATLMAKLTPGELAAYLLRKGFDYPYGDIARLLRTSVPNARQLVRRAQPRIEGDREQGIDPEAHRQLVAAFLTAARTGDLTGLEALLSRTGCARAGCAGRTRPRSDRRRHRSAVAPAA